MTRNFYEELKSAHLPEQRVSLASDINCPIVLLKCFIKDDVEHSVILAAALNVNCPDYLLETAALKIGWAYDILATRKRVVLKEYFDSQDSDEGKFAFGDRDSFLLAHVLNYDNKHGKIHLGNFNIKRQQSPNIAIDDIKVYKGHIVLIMCPAWGIIFPPYNLAKISALLRASGYKVTVFDINVECSRVLKQRTGTDFWSSEKYHLWFGDQFNTKILPYISDYINQVMREIISLAPSIIGFSLYNTNMWCSRIMMEMSRELIPDVSIIVGGPEAAQDKVLRIVKPGVINYIFKGEAEETLLQFLENKTYKIVGNNTVVGTLESKIDLDELPFPDYSDYNLDNYEHPDGLSIETSRGCIAQCSFCSETWFWKFRSRTPERVISEIKDQVNTYGINRFWFVDSLVNGNLKSFRRLIDLILENKLDIRWNSYARNDGRMDREFIFKIVEAGCTSLSYGVESGSQKVLDDMKKKIQVWEIEQNLKDSYEAGMYTHVNWMIGFPTEDHIDFLHSIILIWNTAKYISAISPGMGAGPGALSDMETNWKVYNMAGDKTLFDASFLGRWYTTNYKNTALHRMIRIKIFSVFLDILKQNFGITMQNGQAFAGTKTFYKFNHGHISNITPYITQPTNLNLEIFKSDNPFMDSVENEYVGLLWMLYTATNTELSITLQFDPVDDLENFGSFIATDYAAFVEMSVTTSGDYTIRVAHELKHKSVNSDWVEMINREKTVKDRSFKAVSVQTGNFNDMIVNYNVIGETVHKQYINKSKPISLPTKKYE